MSLYFLKNLAKVFSLLALMACSEPVWGSRIIPTLDWRVRSAEVIVVARLERAQEKQWTMVSNARRGISETRRSYNWGFLRVKEVLKSPEEGHYKGTSPDKLNLIYRGGLEDEVWTSDSDFTFTTGTEGIWLLHENSNFEQSLFSIGFYYVNYRADCLDLESLKSFRERYADILD